MKAYLFIVPIPAPPFFRTRTFYYVFNLGFTFEATIILFFSFFFCVGSIRMVQYENDGMKKPLDIARIGYACVTGGTSGRTTDRKGD